MSQIKLKHSGGNSVIIAAPDSNPASDVTLKLPQADGSTGQFMKTDGSGNLSFGAAGGGKLVRALHAFKKDTQTIAANSGYTAISGLSKSITMSNANNKIIILVTISYGQSANNFAFFKLYDGSSEITDATSTGGSNAFISNFVHPQSITNCVIQVSGSYEFSPNDTNEHTINLYGNPSNSTLSINRRDASASSLVTSTSGLTLLEVAP